MAAPAAASPQMNASFVAGAAGHGSISSPWQRADFASALRASMLFGRERDLDAGWGPFLELGTTDGFDTGYLGGGLELLAPIHPYLPLVLGAGMQISQHPGGGGAVAAPAASIFWGSRGYNYHGSYGMVGGLFLQGSREIGQGGATVIVLGAEVDTMLLVLPILWAAEAIAHG